MSTLSHSRLFKATRRFIVAEVTLIIVIVILFTWSSYVLYKLFASDSESLFGINFKSSLSAKPEISSNNRTNQLDGQLASLRPQADYAHERLVDQTQPVPVVDRTNLQEQLADYKDQILKELLARQQKLLGDDGGSKLMSSLLGLDKPDQYRGNHDNHHRNEPGPRIAELQQWRGGYKLPSSLDYLFENKKNASRERPPSATLNSPLTSTLPGSRPNSLVYLDDAPSLMQLSPSSDTSDATGPTTTSAPPEALGSQSAESHDSNLINDEPQDEVAPTTTEPSNQLADTETTTLEPASREDDADSQPVTTQSPQAEIDSPEPRQTGQDDDADADRTDRSDPNEGSDDERVRNTVKAIDEEVDRMTQPSVGSVSQQDKPPAILKNTVHFDDVASQEGNKAISSERRTKSRRRKNSQISDEPEVLDQRNRRLDQQGLFDGPVPDLLVADNLYKPPLSSTKATNEVEPPPLETNAGHSSRRLHPIVHALDYTPDSSGARNLIDIAEGRKRSRHAVTRARRSPLDYDSLAFPKFDTKTSTSARKNKRNRARLTKRSDDDDEDDDYEDENVVIPDDDNANDNSNQTNEKDSIGAHLARVLSHPAIERKHSISSDPSFEELLAHKQLLDALQQNQLPAPIESGNNSSSTSKKSGQGDDHQSADTHFSIDHGLMLYPSADEEHHHKSKSHKSSKAKKKKSKKKMTAAIKKGGHKSKKHKKEEKKYHKEKKFKGAKKGKKMKKGKGGKGGKKGKKLFKDKGYKKKGFKKTYVKNEFGSKKSYFDEFRDKDFKKKWKNFDDKYKYAQMKKWQAKDVKKAKKMKDHGEKFKKYDKSKWKKKKFAEMSSGSKKTKSKHHKEF